MAAPGTAPAKGPTSKAEVAVPGERAGPAPEGPGFLRPRPASLSALLTHKFHTRCSGFAEQHVAVPAVTMTYDWAWP